MLNNWHKKEKPIQGMMGMGGGTTGYLLGGAGGGPFQLTGGTQSVIGDYTFHKFTNGMPGSFTVDSGETTDAVILIAAGGGGGGCQVGGGGGGGGLIHATSVPLKPGTYNYNVGAGGQGFSYPPGRIGDNGGDSYITFPAGHPYGNVDRRAKGGGGGGSHNTPAGAQPGGSGGGGGGPPTPGGSAIQPGQSNPGWSQYGYSGGTGRVGNWFGGGGGGSAAAGGDAPPNHGGNGGAGRNFPQFPPAFGHSGYFCGGGGGCRDALQGSNGAGGTGGGGQGGGDEAQTPMDVMHGDPETGGGGGGRRDHPAGAGDGGPGVIIIRYPNPT